MKSQFLVISCKNSTYDSPQTRLLGILKDETKYHSKDPTKRQKTEAFAKVVLFGCTNGEILAFLLRLNFSRDDVTSRLKFGLRISQTTD